jgi:hypothetical protein
VGAVGAESIAKANIAAIAGRRVAEGVKGWIRNLALYASNDTNFDDTLRLWFRPESVRETIQVMYQNQGVVGMSHQYQTYAHTESARFPLRIYENALMMLKEVKAGGDLRNTPEGARDEMEFYSEVMENDRRFIEALTVPPLGVTGVVGNEPSPCILCIPGIVTIRARVQSVEFDFTRSDINGRLREWSANVTFQEAPLGRLTMQDVLANGMFRTWGL